MTTKTYTDIDDFSGGDTQSIASTVLPSYNAAQSASQPPPPTYQGSRRIPPDLHVRKLVDSGKIRHTGTNHLEYQTGEQMIVVVKPRSTLSPDLFLHEGADATAPVLASSKTTLKRGEPGSFKIPVGEERFCFADHSVTDDVDWMILNINTDPQSLVCAFRLAKKYGGRQLSWHVTKGHSIQAKTKGTWHLKDSAQIGEDGDAPDICCFERPATEGKGSGTLKWAAEVSREEEAATIIALITFFQRLRNQGTVLDSVGVWSAAVITAGGLIAASINAVA